MIRACKRVIRAVGFIDTHVLPSQHTVALDAEDVPDCMQTGCHVTVFRIAQGDVGDIIKEISAPVLAVECLIIQLVKSEVRIGEPNVADAAHSPC